MESPKFSEFRELMDKWDKASKMFVENGLCLFFKKDGVLYGTTETGRITFARMKNPDSKEDNAWKKEASFTAYDLEKSNDKEKVRRPFGFSDLKKITPIDQDQAEKELEKKGKKIPVINDDEEEGQKYGEL